MHWIWWIVISITVPTAIFLLSIPFWAPNGYSYNPYKKMYNQMFDPHKMNIIALEKAHNAFVEILHKDKLSCPYCGHSQVDNKEPELTIRAEVAWTGIGITSKPIYEITCPICKMEFTLEDMPKGAELELEEYMKAQDYKEWEDMDYRTENDDISLKEPFSEDTSDYYAQIPTWDEVKYTE